MTAGRPLRPPPHHRRHAIRDAIVIAALSIAVTIGGGFHPAVNAAIGLAGGATAAFILHKERRP